MTEIANYIFRANDIRGIADRDLNDTAVASIAVAYGEFLVEKNIKTIGLAKDVRLSSPRIYTVFEKWIKKTGITVYRIGKVPSPAAYFALYTKTEIDAIAIITASHNTAEYNGIKFNYLKKSVTPEEINELYQRSIAVNLSDYENKKGSKSLQLPILEDYIEYLAKQVSLKKKFNIVVDTANATGAIIAKPLFDKIGIKAKIINKKIDGTFPSHEPDPSVAENLVQLGQKVVERDADCGIGYDGDSDRIGVVDDLGRFIVGDVLMALFAKDILKKNPGASVVIEVKSSQLLIDTIKEAGGLVQMTKVGHGFIKRKIAETNALLAGELSGHMFFNDRYFGFDDAFYCTLRLLELLDTADKKLSELIDEFPKYYTSPEVHFPCVSDDEKFLIFNSIEKKFKKYENVDFTDGIRIQFPNGWGLVRPSNTQAMIGCRYEADSEEQLSFIQMEMETIIANCFKYKKEYI